MRRYTITKTLALFFGVLSVVARSLPERRSEINVRSPGDIGDSKHRLEELGLVMVSKSALNGNIHTATYAMSENTTRDTTPEKPCDIRGHQCLTSCHQNIDVGPPGLVECNILYENIKSMEGSFTVEAGQVATVTHINGGCVVAFDNILSAHAYIYDYKNLANVMKSLTSECIIREHADVGWCGFEDNPVVSPYVVLIREVPPGGDG